MKNLSKILLAGLLLIGLSSVAAMEKQYEHPSEDLKVELSIEKSMPDVILIASESDHTLVSNILTMATDLEVNVVVVGAENRVETMKTELPKLMQYKLVDVIRDLETSILSKTKSKFIDPPRFNYKK